MGDLTRNFSTHEMVCKCGCGADYIDPTIVHRLQVVRDILNYPILIHSAVRCSDYNKAVGGKPHSLHLSGKAIDWSVDDLDLMMYAAKLLYHWSGGYHQYETFFHTDVGRKRRW